MDQYTLPEWARMYARPVDLRTSAYWGAQDTMGGGSGTMGNGNGMGYYAPLERFASQFVGNGDGQYSTNPDPAGAMDWLQSTGQQLMEANGGNNESARWLQDANGNITAEPQVAHIEDRNFWNGALLAAAVTGANIYGAGGVAGAAAETTAAGGGTAAGGATTYAPATNAALAESAAGTAGYGASSAGAGGGAGTLSGGLLSGLGDFGTVAQKAIEYAAKNPKVVGGLLGAVGGAAGGGGETGATADTYTGPMPTVSRGQWQPRVQAQMMQVPTFGAGLLEGKKANTGAGLLRFKGA